MSPDFFKQLADFKAKSERISPDSFNHVAMGLFGLSVRQAQNYLALYQETASGRWRHDKSPEENIRDLEMMQKIVDRAMTLQTRHDRYESIDVIIPSYHGDDRMYHIAVWIENDTDGPQMLEFNLRDFNTYGLIDEIINTSRILAIVGQQDIIYNMNDCLDRDKKEMRVYDGDIFVSYNKTTENYWNHPEENGVYIIKEGAYRRLLYTKGRGYVNKKGDPETADDGYEANENVLLFADGEWNHRRLTWDHRWRRIGNIHADISLLTEE